MARYQILNRFGIAELERILIAHHKNGDSFLYAELNAWAETIEFSMAEGNGPSFEIHGCNTNSGQTELFELSPESIEWAGEDDDDSEADDELPTRRFVVVIEAQGGDDSGQTSVGNVWAMHCTIGDTITASLHDENGMPVQVKGVVTEILDEFTPC